MRLPKFLSPSAIGQWLSDREEYYMRYITDNPPPKIPQSQPMSIGSAFDAYAKSYLVTKLLGPKPEFEFDTIFASQVEPHNRDWAKKHGLHAFEAYKHSGALAELMLELSRASSTPRFEFEVEGRIPHSLCIDGVPLLGKPDVYFVTNVGAHIVVDWKVNGYCAKNGIIPKKGYVKVRDGSVEKGPKHGHSHKDAHLLMVGGLEINIGHFFEDVDKDWARQLAIYAWLLGEPVGGNFIICVEQLACAPSGEYPTIRVASHRGRISADYQHGLMKQAAEIWMAVNRGHVFIEMTKEANDERCKTLDKLFEAYKGTTSQDVWFQKMTRSHD
jgi:hypothetical protein